MLLQYTIFFNKDNLVFRLSIFILRELIISSSPATKSLNKSNNKIIEQSSKKQTKSVNNRKTAMALTWYSHFQRNDGLNHILRRQTSHFHYG